MTSHLFVKITCSNDYQEQEIITAIGMIKGVENVQIRTLSDATLEERVACLERELKDRSEGKVGP